MDSARSATPVSREDVFREMFETNFARVVRYAQGQLSDRAAAEDVAAEVFHVAWQKLDPESPFGLPWLIRTAMHKTRDALRSRYRQQATLVALAQAAEGRARGPADLERLALYEALRRIPAKDRQVIELTYWSDLSAGEIAQVLRIREGAVWTRLHRARARLKSLLDVDEGGETA